MTLSRGKYETFILCLGWPFWGQESVTPSAFSFSHLLLQPDYTLMSHSDLKAVSTGLQKAFVNLVQCLMPGLSVS